MKKSKFSEKGGRSKLSTLSHQSGSPVSLFPYRKSRWGHQQYYEAPLITSQTGLVLVVSEVRARRYGAGRVRDGSTRSKERVVGRSAAGAAVGVEEVPSSRPLMKYLHFLRSLP